MIDNRKRGSRYDLRLGNWLRFEFEGFDEAFHCSFSSVGDASEDVVGLSLHIPGKPPENVVLCVRGMAEYQNLSRVVR